MAGIVEPDAGVVLLGGPGIQRQRLGAPHIGMKAAQPEQAGAAAGPGADRDAALATVFADFDENRFRLGCRHY